jgi:lysophospholipase L1-like esterase
MTINMENRHKLSFKIRLFLKSRFFLSFIAVFLVFSIFVFKYFSYIAIYKPINISVYGLDENELKKISFYCNTPLNRKFILQRIENNWSTSNYAFYKNLFIAADDSLRREISMVDIKIGSIDYKFNNIDFNKYWKKYYKADLYVSPESVKDDGSFINMLISISYWDFHISKMLVIFILAILLIIIARKKFLVIFRSLLRNFLKLFPVINFKKILKKIFLFFASIILILFIIEFTLRVYGYFYESKEKTMNKKNCNYTILSIGDSFTYGVGAPEHKDFSTQLEGMLNYQSDKKFKVLNRGVPGQNSTEALFNLKNQIKIYKPELIILCIGDANFRNYSGYGTPLNKFLYKFRIYKLINYYYLNYKQKKVDSEIEKFNWEVSVINEKKGRSQSMLRTENVKSEVYITANKLVKESIEKENKTGTDYHNIATFYLRKHNLTEALKWYDEGITKYPDNYNLNEGLTYLYYFWKKNEDAKKYMKKCLILKNRNDILELKKNNDLNMELRKSLDTSNIENSKLLYFLNSKWGYYYFSNTYYLTLEKLTDKHSLLIREWIASDIQKIVELCNYYHTGIIIHNYPFFKSHFFMITANKILEAMANEYSIPFVDNQVIFSKLGNKIPDYFDLESGGYHPNEKGYGLIAKDLYDKITGIKLFDKK